MLEAHVGDSRVLSRPGGSRMWVLNASSAILWDLHVSGIDPALVAEELAKRFEIATEAARGYLDELYGSWRGAGLLGEDESAGSLCDEFQPIPRYPEAGVIQAPEEDWMLNIADRAVFIEIEDPDLRAVLEALLAPRRNRGPGLGVKVTADKVVLLGNAARWRLTINRAEIDSGAGRDSAVVAMLSALTELGCRTHERLLVVHGGGLLAPDGRCLILVAPGGSGKSTLTMALEAEGFRLLSDDVVPIRADGVALGLGLPACIKRGSWPVLVGCRPELAQMPEVFRFGQGVRFLPPKNRPMTGAIAPDLLLFPQYQPDAGPSCASLAPEQALQRLIEAEAVIRGLTQEKLDAICGWVSAVPAYAIHYPDLASGVLLARTALENRAALFGS